MKILFANKFFYLKGGSENIFFDEAHLLEKNGYQLVFFSMVSPENQPSPYSPYFVSYVDLSQGQGLVNQLKIAGRILYSFEAKKKINSLVNQEFPDIAHLHNIYHQISPSIIDELKKRKIPIVMTLHDYKLTCPIYVLFQNQHLCDECNNGKYYRVLVNRCVKNSRIKSAVNMLEMYLHHQILHIYEKVDVFISPSRFLIHKTKEMGVKTRMEFIPNFIVPEEYIPNYTWEEDSLVYFGRLSEEKGLITLLNAVKDLKIQLKIIGDGPQKEELIKKSQLEHINNVVFLGYKRGNELQNEIKKSVMVVVPSEWYENNPRSIIESFALGKPVIGSDIGGIPELVKVGETGYLFSPGNSLELRNKIELALSERNKIPDLGKQARRFVETELNPEKHYAKLREVYNSVIKPRN